MDNQIIEKFLECDEPTTQHILKQILSYQFDKMIKDINKVVTSLAKYGDTSPSSIDMATRGVVSIYNAEMEYISIIWDEGECWWDENANARFISNYKSLYANCLKEKRDQSPDDWWRRIHIINFKDIIMAN